MENVHPSFIILALATISLFLITRYRKVIGLFLIRLVYGRYSYEYLSLYKRLFIRSPFKYCFRDEFVSHVLFILEMRNDIPSYKTQEDIFFEEQPYFTHYKEFMKIKGAPYCFHAFSFDTPHFIVKVLGYQTTVSGKKGIATFYFIDDVFFMGEYIFKESSKNIRREFLSTYLKGTPVNGDNFYIVNTRERILHYQDNGFNIDIKFLTREDKRILELLKDYHRQMTDRKLNVED